MSESRISILVADHDKVSMSKTLKLLAENNYHVKAVNDWIDVIDIAVNQKIDEFSLLIMNLTMWNKWWLETSEYLREMNIPIPIILLSMKYSEQLEKLCQNMWVNRVLEKPYNWENLLEKIQEMI
ncbi:MAG: hypothetical protein ACD_4C00014G0003 [uncultured bacterium (gcode 4)]|uniref:Response regulatory domain-containing protein n=1 Tax=uncultured bacterium (gcode 4) TaxID=1234023 RepID=K2FZ45_9BACT|nr:MAG: hypothetical protein ACD_4C00014G0003 [uncultured bacterium (gcode 4)]